MKKKKQETTLTTLSQVLKKYGHLHQTDLTQFMIEVEEMQPNHKLIYFPLRDSVKNSVIFINEIKKYK